MANIGPLEIGIVLIIALVVFGPKRLPELGKSLGKGIHEFKGTISGEHSEEKAPELEQAQVVAVAEPVAVAQPVAKAETASPQA